MLALQILSDIPIRVTTLLIPNLRKTRYYTLIIASVAKRRNPVRMNHKLTIEDDLQWKMTLRV
jgi:hypothetical protein